MSTTAAPPTGPAAAAIEQEPRGTPGLLDGKGVPTFGILSSTGLAPIFPRCMSCPVERLAVDAAVA
jgi:hypothetical protein